MREYIIEMVRTGLYNNREYSGWSYCHHFTEEELVDLIKEKEKDINEYEKVKEIHTNVYQLDNDCLELMKEKSLEDIANEYGTML